MVPFCYDLRFDMWQDDCGSEMNGQPLVFNPNPLRLGKELLLFISPQNYLLDVWDALVTSCDVSFS